MSANEALFVLYTLYFIKVSATEALSAAGRAPLERDPDSAARAAAEASAAATAAVGAARVASRAAAEAEQSASRLARLGRCLEAAAPLAAMGPPEPLLADVAAAVLRQLELGLSSAEAGAQVRRGAVV